MPTESVKDVYYQPWVGDRYKDAPLGKRVLVLGESHYQKEPRETGNWQGLTIECVKAQVNNTHRKQFWTNIVISFLNRYPTPTDKADFWHSVAFYNYVQQSVGLSARIRPQDYLWRTSAPAFIEVLNSLKPEVIIVLGYSLWRNLPPPVSAGPTIEMANQTATRYYSYKDGSCLAYGIKHPSSGFNAFAWYPYIMQVLDIASSKC